MFASFQVSATDPVAVVALLEELGAPIVLRAVIEGESLLNDGAAIVVFRFCQMLMKSGDGEEIDWAKDVAVQLIAVPGSTLIGYVAARVVVWFLIHAFRDVNKEQGILVIAVFGVYTFCDHELIKGSGVLGVVVFGVTLSMNREFLNPNTVDEVLHLWLFLAYWANCVVFILSGLIIGSAMVEHGKPSFYKDVIISITAYLFSVLSRALVLMLIGSAFRLHQKRSKQHVWPLRKIFMMFWGGLRGAVGLLLAMQLKGLVSKPIHHLALFYVGITVFLSLGLQGTSYEPLIRYFKMNKTSCFMERRMEQRLKNLKEIYMEQRQHLQSDKTYYCLSSACWKEVWRIAEEALIGKQARKRKAIESERKETEPVPVPVPVPVPEKGAASASASASASSPDSAEQPVKHALESYLNLLKSRLGHMWELGLFSRKTVNLLVYRLDVALDRCQPLDIEALCREQRTWKWIETLADYVKVCVPVRRKHPMAQDWWKIFAFCLLIVQLALSLHILLHSSSWRFAFLAIFFLSTFFIFEQLALLLRHLQWLRSQQSWMDRMQLCMDIFYIFYYFVLLVLIGHNLEKSRERSDEQKPASDCTSDAFCNATLIVTISGLSFRVFINTLPSLLLAWKLLAEQLCLYVESKKTYRIATLNALVRIAEDVHYELLAEAIPGEGLSHLASSYNRELKRTTEKLLVENFRDASCLKLGRWVETKQSARILLNAIFQNVKHMEREGILSVEEFKELEGTRT